MLLRFYLQRRNCALGTTVTAAKKIIANVTEEKRQCSKPKRGLLAEVASISNTKASQGFQYLQHKMLALKIVIIASVANLTKLESDKAERRP